MRRCEPLAADRQSDLARIRPRTGYDGLPCEQITLLRVRTGAQPRDDYPAADVKRGKAQGIPMAMGSSRWETIDRPSIMVGAYSKGGNSMSVPDDDVPLKKQDGVTDSERYLHALCHRSFLSLWSYPGVYRDQGVASGNGKEVCDLLVVFGEHVIVFSDKDCAFPDCDDLRLAWQRWFRKAVQKSAEQIWGAERWIRTQTARLFLDRACKQPFPLDLPPVADMKFHRIVVAHGVAEIIERMYGGSGSLMIDTGVTEKAHYSEDCDPFVIGDLCPSRGFVHVFDDVTLNVILEHLDTISDFVNYLTQKENAFRSGTVFIATGEEDVLAEYSSRLNDKGEHDIVVPSGTTLALFQEGKWSEFLGSPEYARQQEANRPSYLIDEIIERFGGHILGRTSIVLPGNESISSQEFAVRSLASTCRTVRRMLGRSLLEIYHRSMPGKNLTRVCMPPRAGHPFYVMLLMHHPPEVDDDRYRDARCGLLEAYCLGIKLKFPNAHAVVGLATETQDAVSHSEDIVYVDLREWPPERQAEAEEVCAKLGILKKTSPQFNSTEYEYPRA